MTKCPSGKEQHSVCCPGEARGLWSGSFNVRFPPSAGDVHSSESPQGGFQTFLSLPPAPSNKYSMGSAFPWRTSISQVLGPPTYKPVSILPFPSPPSQNKEVSLLLSKQMPPPGLHHGPWSFSDRLALLYLLSLSVPPLGLDTYKPSQVSLI